MIILGLVIFHLCFLYQIDFTYEDSGKQTTVRLYQFKGKCQGYENTPMYLKDVHVMLINRVYYISFKRVTKVNVTDDIRLELTLNRCRGRESSDSCEKYQKIVMNHLCELLEGDNKPWSPVLKRAEMPMGCPVAAGVVTITNGTFDGDAFSRFPVSGWIWKVTAKLLNERTRDLIMCVYLEGQLAPV